MSTTKISMNYEAGVQKGCACDASQFTAMRRQQTIVRDIRDNINNGKKPIVDGQRTRGTDGGASIFYATRGAYLNFLLYQ
jgi:hypothetical protein